MIHRTKTAEGRLKIYQKMANILRNPDQHSWPTVRNFLIPNFSHLNDDTPVYCLCSLTKIASCYTSYLDKENLPELYAQRPKKCWAHNRNFWWKPTNRKTRLKAVERAVELCTAEIDRIK